MNYPENIESKIGFNTIRHLLEQSCASDLGKTHISDMGFCGEYTTIFTALQECKEMMLILSEDDAFPIPSFTHVAHLLNHLQKEGTYIQTSDLITLIKSLLEIQQIVAFFAKHKELYPYIYEHSQTIAVPASVIKECSSILTEQGTIKDSASPGLRKIRNSLVSLKKDLHKTMQISLRQAVSEGWAESGTEISVRNNRLVIPVLSSYKRKIKGVVHDESSTGKTSYVEPSNALVIQNSIANLQFEEKREIIAILTQIASIIRPYIYEIEHAYLFLGFIDALKAKATVGLQLSCTIPQLQNEAIIDLYGGRHPGLVLSHSHTKKPVIPLRILLDESQRIIIISGPNAGGKSVCMKTVILLQYMIQCGLPVPCDSHSKMGVFSHIFVDIGDEQSIENDLSTYSSHLHNMKFFIEHAHEKTLCCIDEFGTGTEPALGGAIAESILETFISRNLYGVLTTHYTNLKLVSKNYDTVINGAMLFDSENMKPLYKLRMGSPGSSFAFEIAETIGIPQRIIDNAKQKIGTEHVDFEKNLKKIEEEKQYIFRQKQKIKHQQKELQLQQKDYSEKLAKLSDSKQDIVKKAQKELEDIIAHSNKDIERTIRSIKEHNADKERTKQLRSQLHEKQTNTLKTVSGKIRKAEPPKSTAKKAASATLKTGDFVTIHGQTMIGEIIEMSNKHASVSFGDMISHVPIKKLERSKDKPQTKKQKNVTFSGTIHKKHANFSPKIDVRGTRGDDALIEVEKFIETGYTMHIGRLEILHGKGYGILRELIRNYLAGLNFITHFEDAPIDMGGDGITIVYLD
ncbi:MAG: Smr/MutS family protein [Bacteroidales bacterium]